MRFIIFILIVAMIALERVRPDIQRVEQALCIRVNRRPGTRCTRCSVRSMSLIDSAMNSGRLVVRGRISSSIGRRKPSHLCSLLSRKWSVAVVSSGRVWVASSSVVKQLLNNMDGYQLLVNGRVSDGAGLGFMPDLLDVGAEREPDSDQVGRGEDDAAKVHERLDVLLEEGVIGRVGLMMEATLA